MNLECPKCRTSMESGFLVDHSYTAFMQARWVSGEPQKGWFQEVKASQASRGVKVFTLRCPACGYLESYAPPEMDKA